MATARKMRGFKRWMKREGVECSDALHISLSERGGTPSISVTALCDLMEGDVVAVIPKRSCLTVKTSAASHIIEEAEVGGYLGLAVALMYERSLGPQSKWFQYLQILPSSEPIPLLWSLLEIDSLLCGTEIHKIVKEDKALVYQDWKECIKPLLDSASLKLNPEFFSVDEYLAAKSLIASRSFQIDEYHGYGMVPLADLFNHKTAAEDVHFTSVSYDSESDIVSDNRKRHIDDEKDGDDELMAPDFHSEMGGFGRSELEFESSSSSGNDVMDMQMIICKDVVSGAEVFNTYGSLGNAALLHRYGFTEPVNPFDILNIDLETVLQWSSSVFSCRLSRRRLSLWRKLGYSGCVSQNSQYFEISLHGEPQVELLVLLNILLLPEEAYHELELALLSVGNSNQTTSKLMEKYNFLFVKGAKLSKELLLTRSVRQTLFSLADAREHFYGPSSLQDDIKSFNESCQATDHKLYHSLMLRISERRILDKLRSYAASGTGMDWTKKRAKRVSQDSTSSISTWRGKWTQSSDFQRCFLPKYESRSKSLKPAIIGKRRKVAQPLIFRFEVC